MEIGDGVKQLGEVNVVEVSGQVKNTEILAF